MRPLPIPGVPRRLGALLTRFGKRGGGEAGGLQRDAAVSREKLARAIALSGRLRARLFRGADGPYIPAHAVLLVLARRDPLWGRSALRRARHGRRADLQRRSPRAPARSARTLARELSKAEDVTFKSTDGVPPRVGCSTAPQGGRRRRLPRPWREQGRGDERRDRSERGGLDGARLRFRGHGDLRRPGSTLGLNEVRDVSGRWGLPRQPSRWTRGLGEGRRLRRGDGSACRSARGGRAVQPPRARPRWTVAGRGVHARSPRLRGLAVGGAASEIGADALFPWIAGRVDRRVACGRHPSGARRPRSALVSPAGDRRLDESMIVAGTRPFPSGAIRSGT